MTGPATPPRPPMDGYGRYLLPDPASGRERPYTRTTTLARTIAEVDRLERWKRRKVVEGLATDPVLVRRAVAVGDDRDGLDELAEEAMTTAGAGAGASRGTELHAVIEQINTGAAAHGAAPEEHLADVVAYGGALLAAGIEVLPGWCERLVVNPAVDVAGTLDMLVRLPDGRIVVADLKTGADLSYSWGEIAVQLAVYANAPSAWDHGLGRWVDMPDVDTSVALVVHLPAGQGRCGLFEVDTVRGWEAAGLAAAVRRYRQLRNLATALDPEQFRVEGQIIRQIAEADDPADLTSLWAFNLDRWTPAHTRAAQRRKAELTSTSVN